ncbi:hypothetical protein BECAL_01774 [Bellilinea caldifistulae]|uniref:Uncharacterized protein n=1 Tax=Bellilinea caldifistulae TaxID=360411 RepID=A0A0P6X4W0_9CHLR|nr:hypothetical protein [Bellilinea caldifistulae]KPL74966.1 hypothetical protein AC812_10650 [Bellilinea caldifistulae]GAP10601.1 hypothetical protein BECAL_01774 [Bellilinea caldifistulae]
MSINNQNQIFFCGYVMFPGVDVNEYWDFVRKSMPIRDVKNGLEMGIFPPGLVMKDDYNNLAIVDRDRRTLRKLSWWV